MNYSLKGKLVTIRPPAKSDTESIYRNAKSRDIARTTFVPWPYTRKHAEDFIRNAHKSLKNETAFNFAIVPHDVDEVVGMIDLRKFNPRHKNAETGYWMGRNFRNKGYTVDAVKLLLSFAFNQLKCQRVQAHTVPANRVSQRVLEKAGFTFEGTLRRYVRHHGRYKDICMYSILKSEFKPRTKN